MPADKQVAPAPAGDSGAEPLLAEQLNARYEGMDNDAVRKRMRFLVYVWSATQLFGSFAMPAWIAVFATQWYTAVNLVPGEVALVVTFSKCIDVMTDPMMACYLRGCTMHKIANIAVVGAIIQGIAFIGLFIPFKPIDPEGGRARVLGQYAFFYVLFFIGDTLTGTPTTTLGNMLKSQKILDEDHHNDGLRVGSMMKVVGIMSMGVITFICMVIVKGTFGEMGPEDGVQAGLFPYTNLIVAIISSLLHIVINAWLRVLLGQYGDSSISPEVFNMLQVKSFLQQFSSMMSSSFNNCFFRQLIFAWMCDQLTITLMKNLLMWFVRHRVEPEMAKGCEAYEDPDNVCLREIGGFESGVSKRDFECKATNAAVVAVFFLIMGAIVGNVFWQKKIESERDRFGNRNLYQNWLFFNLSSAVTNGLMVFVGRGDTRLFWVLCFINGLPAGGEFMTDTILLFLIGSEVYSTRSDRQLTSAGEAEQLDSHTTKFAMMKTFIPKAVSLVAEALPLALIQIWYREPREICRDAVPPIEDINSVECANFLVYNETGAPKHIPQEPQVGELIAFFFFILPTVTCLLSYYIKSRFQVTDSGELVMLNQTRRGAPDIDRDRLSRTASGTSMDDAGDDGTPADDDCITETQKTEVQKTLNELLERLSVAAAMKSPSNASRSIGAPAVAPSVGMTREALDSYVQHLQHLYEAPQKVSDKATGKSEAGGLALSNVQHPKFQTDEWIGTIIPTTNEQHLFKLPALDHPLATVPLSILQWATRDDPEELKVSALHLKHTDTETLASVKGAVHGLMLPIYFVVRLAVTVVYVLVVSTIYFIKHLVPGQRETIPNVQLSKIQLFGVLGKSTIVSFGEMLAPILAAHVIAPGDPSQVPALKADVLAWLAEARKKEAVQVQQGGKRVLPTLNVRDFALVSTKQTSKVVHAGDPLPIEARCVVRIAYLRAGGIAFAVLMALVVAIVLGVAGFQIVSGAWSIVVTVPLFLSAMGLVIFLFCHGLMGLAEPCGDSPPEINRERHLDADSLTALGVLHFNTYNTAGGKPLIYFSSDSPTDLLSGINRDIRVVNEKDDPRPPTDPVLSYMVYVPANCVQTAVRMLVPIHDVFDRVAKEANNLRAAVGDPANVKWSVANIASPAAYPQYRCFVYCWNGVQPPMRKKKIF